MSAASRCDKCGILFVQTHGCLTLGEVCVMSRKPPSMETWSDADFCIKDATFESYFRSRGGVDTFGLPASRMFMFLGCPVQLFQRLIIDSVFRRPNPYQEVERNQHCRSDNLQSSVKRV